MDDTTGPATADTGGAPSLLRSTPVLRVTDYALARAHYVAVLGFHVREEGGSPPRFGIVECGGAVLFLDGWHGGPTPRVAGWDAYIHVRDVRGLYEQMCARGATVGRALELTPWSTREFDVLDVDGNRLCFGEHADPGESL